MIGHIDKYFSPSGAVNSLSYIFDLIDIKQALDESVITLKAWFSRLFASLKLGGVALTQRCRLGSCSGPFSPTAMGWFRTFALVATLCPHPHFNSLWTNAGLMTKTPGKGRLARMTNQHGPLQPTRQAPPAMAPILTTSSPLAHSTFTCVNGAMDAKMAVTNVWCATIHQTSPPIIIARISQSSRKLGLNLSNEHQPTAGTCHLESAKPRPLQPHLLLHPQLWVLRPIVPGLPQHPGPPRL
jgi:hypothetical protein